MVGFETALAKLKEGAWIWREGWLSETVTEELEMFVVLQKGYPDGIPINKNTSEVLGLTEGTVIKFKPYLMLRLPDNSCVPYTATTQDILAEDWQWWS